MSPLLRDGSDLKNMMTEGENSERIMQHAHIKRIADAYVVGNPQYNSEEESRRLLSNVVTVNTDFITEVLRQTIKE